MRGLRLPHRVWRTAARRTLGLWSNRQRTASTADTLTALRAQHLEGRSSPAARHGPEPADAASDDSPAAARSHYADHGTYAAPPHRHGAGQAERAVGCPTGGGPASSPATQGAPKPSRRSPRTGTRRGRSTVNGSGRAYAKVVSVFPAVAPWNSTPHLGHNVIAPVAPAAARPHLDRDAPPTRSPGSAAAAAAGTNARSLLVG